MKFAIIGFAVATAAWISNGGPGNERHSLHVSATTPKQGDNWSWHGRIAAGKTVEIRGINGDVSADAADGAEVQVTATKRGRRSDPDEVRIEAVEGDDGVRICVIYPGDHSSCGNGGGHSSFNNRNNDVEVNFTVHLPRGVAFDGNTVNGDVEATGLTGPVEANSVNGAVRIETTSGEASASSVNGAVTATVHALGTGAMNFKSVNGSVNVTLPANISADIDAQTVNGSIDTDFPITVNGRMSPRHLRGSIGQGGRRLELETVNGSIRLHKLP
jgi:DUF4097 and DUF4098 domain-containing protein YvlB